MIQLGRFTHLLMASPSARNASTSLGKKIGKNKNLSESNKGILNFLMEKGINKINLKK